MQWISRLGYDPSKVVLIIHADDGGASEEHNSAILECFNAGVVTSASAFAYGKSFDHFAEKVAPELGDVGIHLECSFEQGRTKGMIEQEFDAQYNLFVEKITPTHMDSHGGVVFRSKSIFESYIAFSKARKLLALAKNKDDFIDRILLSYRFPIMTDIFISPYGLMMDSRLEWMKKALDNLRPGLYQLIVHPHKGDDLSGYSDYWALRHPSFMKLIKNNKFVLTSWKEISNRFFVTFLA